MSDNLHTVELLKYVERLEQYCKPNNNDKRHADYVRYINRFLEFFGNEKIYLVGSTGEKSKLRWSTDGGDADFIMVSGKLAIPKEKLEHRQEMPVYVWVRGENLDQKYCGELVEGKYICPEILRSVSPNLYTLLRAVYLTVTATSDSIPGRESRLSTTATDSKVGLAREEFRNLKIDGEDQLQASRKRTDFKYGRSPQVADYLLQRWRDVNINTNSLKLLNRILKMIASGSVPGTRGEYFGNFAHFAHVADSMINRPPLRSESADSFQAQTYNNNLGMEESHEVEKIRATFSEKSSKDFVPALLVIGILPFMEEFRKRVRDKAWPPHELAEEVFKKDVFVVSRRAPINTEAEKDFCLSFNLAEIQLTQNLPGIAKKVFIVLKAYLKGVLKREFEKRGKSFKLKTYHMKMVMFWVCEQENLELWEERNILRAVQKALAFLYSQLEAKCLKHYFVLSNLFVGFEEEDFSLLLELVHQIQDDPIKSIECFFEMDRENKGVTYLTPAEVESIVAMKYDGGNNKFADQLEEAMIEIVRGFNDGPKDAQGNEPIREAVLDIVDMFLEDEKNKQQSNESRNADGRTRQVNEIQAVAGVLNNLVTDGGREAHTSNEAKQRMNFFAGLASLFPEGRRVLSELGGSDGVMNVLRDTANEDLNKGAELRASVDSLLTCSDEQEKDVMLEVKQKISAYFLGRKEN